MACSNLIESKFALKVEDPCPAVSSGSFKVANVCKADPYVYYTPTQGTRAQDFNEGIDDIKYIDKLDPKTKKFFMASICDLKNGVKDKTTLSTIVVEKLIPVETYLESHSPAKFLTKYVKFISSFLRELNNYDVADYRKIITTDFKPENIMVNKTGRIFITDFSPLRQRTGDRWGYVATPLFLLGDDFVDYAPLGRYTSQEISIIGVKMFVLTALTTLYHLARVVKLYSGGLKMKTAIDQGFSNLYALRKSKKKTLIERIEFMMETLKGELSSKDMTEVGKWIKIVNKIQTPQPKGVIGKGKLTAGGKQSKKTPETLSKSKCQEFLKKAKAGKLTLTNPITGRQIAANGAVAKRIMKQCI